MSAKRKIYLRADLRPRVNVGFAEQKPQFVGDIIDAPFECVNVIERPSGTFVIISIMPGEAAEEVTRMFNAQDLLGLAEHPCVKEDDRLLIDDEHFRVTWEGKEIAFREIE